MVENDRLQREITLSCLETEEKVVSREFTKLRTSREVQVNKRSYLSIKLFLIVCLIAVGFEFSFSL